jgi:hypothetical protein
VARSTATTYTPTLLGVTVTVLELTTILLCKYEGSHLQFNEGAVEPEFRGCVRYVQVVALGSSNHSEAHTYQEIPDMHAHLGKTSPGTDFSSG